jgi:uncharacterized membrane protein
VLVFPSSRGGIDGRLGISQEVTGVGGALAGLILVYIGIVVNSYGTYRAEEQRSVKGRLQTRAWLAFVGVTLALLATAVMVIGKWLKNDCAANVSVFVLLAAIAWTIFVAVATVREIK